MMWLLIPILVATHYVAYVAGKGVEYGRIREAKAEGGR